MWNPSNAGVLLLLTSTSPVWSFSMHHPQASLSSLNVGWGGDGKRMSSTILRGGASDVVNDTPITLPEFANSEEYVKYMEPLSELPQGFAIGTAQGSFVAQESPLLGELPIKGTIIYLTDGPTDSWAASFTQNKFPGAPIIVGRSRVAAGGPLHAVVVNNKVSNVCSGGDGVADAEQVCKAASDALDLPGGPETVLPSSTGVIGWRLPATELAEKVVPDAVADLKASQKGEKKNSALDASVAIMTTDRFAKVRSKTLSNGARLVGVAKGAGMIEPNMATMLSYLMTDATVDRETLRELLPGVVNESFNSISVDGDESTSDTVALIASNRVPGELPDGEFKAALLEVCSGLAADIVRNGEGTGHVMRVKIDNFPGTALQSRRLGQHVVNSPLFKCAVSGNDPNTGRLAGAIGSYMGKHYDGPDSETVVDRMSITLGGRIIFADGKFVLGGDEIERELSNHMADGQYDEHSDYPPHQKFVEIGIDFGGEGSTSSTVIGSDLTGEYVVINADYRS